MVPTLSDIRAAAARIAGTVGPTPLIYSHWLSEIANGDVWLKLELIQPTGSYKIRGAVNALARLKETNPAATTVVTASAGNHGQAIALAASKTGFQARVHLPSSAPETKRQGMKRLGTEVVDAGSYDDAELLGRKDAATSGATYVSPYNDADVMAGAGTVALEMFAARPDLDALLVPLGGGGLLAGTAIVARALAPQSLIVGVEAEASPVFTGALAAGKPVTVPVQDTLADGLAGNMEPDTRTFPVVRDLVDLVELVPDAWIARAMRNLLLRERLVAEGAGAIGVAALLRGGLDLAGRRTGIILSGRNVDARVIEWLITDVAD
jgi:threonine dehydratase